MPYSLLNCIGGGESGLAKPQVFSAEASRPMKPLRTKWRKMFLRIGCDFMPINSFVSISSQIFSIPCRLLLCSVTCTSVSRVVKKSMPKDLRGDMVHFFPLAAYAGNKTRMAKPGC